MPRFISLLALSLLTVTVPAIAQDDRERVERGWYFYEDPKKKEDPEYIITLPPQTPAPVDEKEEKKQNCTNAEEWTVECGFIDPGDSFDFQAKQRDALMTEMVMNPNNPQAVEAFQYYNKWILDQTTVLANMWAYNLAQNPELDATVHAPVSRFGLNLVSKLEQNRSDRIFELMKKEGAFLVYFTRTDCPFCHDMLPSMRRVAKATGLDLWNASLDEQCMPGIELCLTKEQTETPASILQVKTVPTTFVYIPDNTWIRVATGVTSDESMKARIVNFFSGYKSALAKGIESEEGVAPMDFGYLNEEDTVKGVAEGVKPAELQGSLPDIRQLMESGALHTESDSSRGAN